MEEDGYFLPSDIFDPTSSSVEADFLGDALLEELGGSGSSSHGAIASNNANVTADAGAVPNAVDRSLASYATSQIAAAAASIPLSVEGTNPMAKAFTPTRPIPPRGPPPGLAGPPPTPPAATAVAMGLSPLRGISSGSGSASDGTLSGFALSLGSEAAPRPLGLFVTSPLRNNGVGSLDSAGSGVGAGSRGVAVGPLLGLQDGALSPGPFFGMLPASPDPGRITPSPPPPQVDRGLDKGLPPAKAPVVAPHWDQPQPSQVRQPPSPLRAASLSATPPRSAALRQQQQQQLGGVWQRPLLPPPQPQQSSSPPPPQQQQQQERLGRNKNGVTGQQQQPAAMPAQAQQAWLPGVLAAAIRAAPKPTNGSGSSGAAAHKSLAASAFGAGAAAVGAATGQGGPPKAGAKVSVGQANLLQPQESSGTAAPAAAVVPTAGSANFASGAPRATSTSSTDVDVDVSGVSGSGASLAVSSSALSLAAAAQRTGKATATVAKDGNAATSTGKLPDMEKDNQGASPMRPSPTAKHLLAGNKSASPEVAEIRSMSGASNGSQNTTRAGSASSKAGGVTVPITARPNGHEDNRIAALPREREVSAAKGRKAPRDNTRHAASKLSRERAPGGRSNLKGSNVLSFGFSPSSVLAAGGAMLFWMAATAARVVRSALVRTRLLQRSGALISAFLQLSGALLSLLLCLVGLVLAVCFAGFWVALRVHKSAARELFCHAHIPLSFVMPYTFPRVARLFAEIEWAPHWVPVCLWYSFLGQFLLAPGPAPAASGFGSSDGSGSNGPGRLWRRALRMLLPVALLWEGAEGRSLLMDLHGGELLLLSFALAALRAGALTSPVFLTSWSAQALAVALWGPSAYMEYYQAVLSLASLRAISAVDLMRNGCKYDARYRASVSLTDGFRPVRTTSTSAGLAAAGSANSGGGGGVSSLFTGGDGLGWGVTSSRSMAGM